MPEGFRLVRSRDDSIVSSHLQWTFAKSRVTKTKIFKRCRCFVLGAIEYLKALASPYRTVTKFNTFFLSGSVSGQPNLEPPTGHFCPNVHITYTCHDSNVTSMTWFAEPHISRNRGIPYVPGFISNESMKKYDSFYTQATNFSVDIETEKFISVTTILTVITSGIENGTNTTCLTFRGGYPLVSSSILYFAGNDPKIGNFDSYN